MCSKHQRDCVQSVSFSVIITNLLKTITTCSSYNCTYILGTLCKVKVGTQFVLKQLHVEGKYGVNDACEWCENGHTCLIFLNVVSVIV